MNLEVFDEVKALVEKLKMHAAQTTTGPQIRNQRILFRGDPGAARQRRKIVRQALRHYSSR